jgi:hypothetical protein
MRSYLFMKPDIHDPTHPLFCLSIPLVIISLFIFFVNDCQGQTVAYPSSFPQEVAQDLKYLLQQATGKTWKLESGQAEFKIGFILIQNTNRPYKSGESAYIISDGATFVRIEAPTINGLIYGSYNYMRSIGFNFYLPDELYTVLPASQNIFKKTAVMVTPALHIREFFGTGGFGSGKTDPGQLVQKSWQLWKWRNGFGSEFKLEGHVGETFNLENAEKLEKHPDWTATPVKINGQTNQNTRLNYFNKEAVDYFTDWVLRKFRAKGYKAPPSYITDLVSIEPADGGNYKTQVPPKSPLKSANPSDQVFYSANMAAEKLDNLFPNNPNIGVNLYAYSDHADVPSFPLHKRVFVQLIPYQFQNISYGPAFIKRWAGTAKRFGIYDYYKYPDASWDLPGGISLEELMNRAVYTTKAGSEGTTYESSYSKFSTAIPLWILVRYLADGDPNWQTNYNRLVSNLFKEAKVPVKKMFDLFYQSPQFSRLQLPEVYELMDEAENLAKDQTVKKRLSDVKLYITYIATYYRGQSITSTSIENNLLPVAQLAWNLYQSKVIDSYRIMQLVSYTFLNANPADKGLKSRYQQLHLLTFPESDEPSAFWRKDWNINQSNFDQHYKKNAPKLDNNNLTVANIISLDKQLQISKQQFKPSQELIIQSDYTVRGYISLFAEKPVTITINWKLKGQGNTLPSLTISGMSGNYSTIYDERLSGTTGQLQLNISQGKTYLFMNAASNSIYNISVKLKGAYAYFEGSPRGKMNFIKKDGMATYSAPEYPSYFYVPGNIESVQYKVQANALQIFDPENKPVTTTLLTSEGGVEIRQFLVPKNYRNKFYKLEVTGNYNYQLLNIPDQYFLLNRK